MSIINDALKKAQRQMTKPENNENTPNHSSSPNSQSEGNSPNPLPQNETKDISSLYAKFYQKQTKVQRADGTSSPGNPSGGAKAKVKTPFTFKTFFQIVLCLGIVIGSLAYIVHYVSSKESPADMRRAFLNFKKSVVSALKFKPAKPARQAMPARAAVPEPPPLPAAVVTAPTSTPKAPVQTQAQVQTSPAETLVLNGTVRTEDHQAALINDQIYEVGDMIGDKKIISIDLNQVQIQDGENIITLKAGGKK